LALGCAPDFDDRSYLVEQSRLIAVMVEPPEARPGERINVFPVVAGGKTRGLSFRFCTQPRPPAEPRPIAVPCLDDAGIVLEANGPGAEGTIPADACARFGPDPVGGDLRPVDADASGGFYQPLIVSGFEEASVAFVRVHCPLPDAPVDLSRALEERYRLNQNPALSELTTTLAGTPPPELSLPSGKSSQVLLTFPETAQESYVWLLPNGDALEARTEDLRVGWFVSSGKLASSTTGAVAGFFANTFTPDGGAEQVELWAVLQDSRGGSAAKHWRLRVEP
jgi:hypothetical protein